MEKQIFKIDLYIFLVGFWSVVWWYGDHAIAFPHLFHLPYGTLGDLTHGIVVKLSCKIIKLKNQRMFKTWSKNVKYITAKWY